MSSVGFVQNGVDEPGSRQSFLLGRYGTSGRLAGLHTRRGGGARSSDYGDTWGGHTPEGRYTEWFCLSLTCDLSHITSMSHRRALSLIGVSNLVDFQLMEQIRCDCGCLRLLIVVVILVVKVILFGCFSLRLRRRLWFVVRVVVLVVLIGVSVSLAVYVEGVVERDVTKPFRSGLDRLGVCHSR